MRRYRFTTLFALLVPALAGHADTLNFSFGSAQSPYVGSGVLTTGTLLAPGEFRVSQVTGTVTPSGLAAVAITSLLSAGTFPTSANGGSFPANDNVVFFSNGTGTFSQDGVSFLLANGTQVNLFNGGTGADIFVLPEAGSGFFETAPISIRAAAATTPEPASFWLLATGLVGACLLWRAN